MRYIRLTITKALAIDGYHFKALKRPLGKSGTRMEFPRRVTTRHLAEVNSRRQVAIVTSTDDSIVAKDLNGIITDWNFGAERVFGFTADQMSG